MQSTNIVRKSSSTAAQRGKLESRWECMAAVCAQHGKFESRWECVPFLASRAYVIKRLQAFLLIRSACRPSATVCASPDPFFLASFYHRVCSNCSTLAASRVTATMTPLVFMANGISVIEVLPRFCPLAFCTLHRLHLFLALMSSTNTSILSRYKEGTVVISRRPALMPQPFVPGLIHAPPT